MRYSDIVAQVIHEADILLIVCDARRIEESINKGIELQILAEKKKFLYVINKVDLITKQEQDQIRFPNSVQISAKEHWGTLRLFRKLMQMTEGKPAVVGIVGYPNTGKSMLINALKGRHSARVSSSAGYTKALQKIRINKTTVLLDTPGLISYGKVGDAVLVGAVDPSRMKDAEAGAFKLMEEFPGKIEKYYGVEKGEDLEEVLEGIALKRGVLKRGGEPDSDRMARDIIRAWQKGTIK